MLRKQLTNICSTTTALPCYCYYHTENYLVYQFTYNKKLRRKFFLALLSGRQDSNLRPPGPKPGALPGCATPRLYSF